MPAHSNPGRWPIPVRILIVESHALLRRAIKGLVESDAGFMVCGQARTLDQGLAAIACLRPGLVIIGLPFDAIDGLAGLAQVARQQPGLPLLAVAMHDPQLMARHALLAGARAYVAKAELGTTLLGAIHLALADASPAASYR